MKKIIEPFTQHPASVNESYFQHFLVSCGFGVKMIVAGLGCLVHGFFPFLCVNTGSTAILKLREELNDKRGS